MGMYGLAYSVYHLRVTVEINIKFMWFLCSSFQNPWVKVTGKCNNIYHRMSACLEREVRLSC